MANTKCIQGKFWLPETPKNMLQGKLLVSEDSSISLILDGFFDAYHLSPPSDIPSDEQMMHSVICGVSASSKILLTEVIGMSVKNSISKQTSKYMINTAMIGDDFGGYAGNDILIKEISLSYTALELFLGKYKTTRDYSQDQSLLEIKCNARYESFNLNDTISASVQYSYNYECSYACGCISVTPLTRIVLTCSKSIPLKEWFDIVDLRLGMFFSTLIGWYTCPIDIVIPERESQSRFEVYHQFAADSYTPARIRRNVFDFSNSELIRALNKFYTFAEGHYDIIVNYRSILRRRSLLEDRYKTQLAIIEAFCRDTSKDYYFIHPDCYNKKIAPSLKQSIKQELPDSDQKEILESLYRAIEHANSKNLRQAVKEMIMDNMQILKRLGFKELEVKNLVHNIVETRIQLTHIKSNGSINNSGKHLGELFGQASTIFQVSFLKYLEMSDELVAKIVGN
jgi:hypothetical protein